MSSRVLLLLLVSWLPLLLTLVVGLQLPAVASAERGAANGRPPPGHAYQRVVDKLGREGHGDHGDGTATRNHRLISADELADDELWIASFHTTAGNFTMEIHPAWSPLGARHFIDLVQSGYFDGQKVFRVIPGFLVQFGYHGDPAVSTAVMKKTIRDDPFKVSNRRGYVAFAGNARHSRRTNVFINLVDNTFIDHRDVWATPFGRVRRKGMAVVRKFYAGYNALPQNKQPDQGKLGRYGNPYLEDEFPQLTEIVKVEVRKQKQEEEEKEAGGSAPPEQRSRARRDEI